MLINETNGMKIGYARLSTQDQKLDLQLDDLKIAKCDKIYQEKISSTKERPLLVKMLENLREGDTVVVLKLDRLGRSLKELIALIDVMHKQGVAPIPSRNTYRPIPTIRISRIGTCTFPPLPFQKSDAIAMLSFFCCSSEKLRCFFGLPHNTTWY